VTKTITKRYPPSIDHCAVVSHAQDLVGIHDKGRNLVYWPRPLDPTTIAAATRLAECVGEDWRTTACLADGDSKLSSLLPADVVRVEPGAAATVLADIAFLVATFRMAHPNAHAEAALAVLRRPQCPRFHTDFVGVRLLHTWCGPGTEWIANDEVDRVMLRRMDRGDTPPVLGRRFVTRSVPPFAVALLRGDASPGNSGNGIVHRSPDPRGTPRLVLTIDDGVRGDAAQSAQQRRRK